MRAMERASVNVERYNIETREACTQSRFFQRSGGLGFTLIELLVVVAIIGILASLLLPGLNRARGQALTVKCLSQMKQFSCAWLMYAGDNEDRVPPNEPALGPLFLPEISWVRGWLQLGISDWPDNIDTRYLVESHLGPYLSFSSEVWHCPADSSRTLQAGVPSLRVRSYAMNCYLNAPDWCHPGGPWRVVRKIAEMTLPAPCSTFVIADEREDSIEDGYFIVDMDGTGGILLSVPRSAHNGGGTLSFADGHAERKRWRDPRTNPPLNPNGFVGISHPAHPINLDMVWLRERTTGLK